MDKIEIYKNGVKVREAEQIRSGDGKGFIVRYELLGIIAIMIIQFCGAIWWASSMASEVRYVRSDLTKLTLAVENGTRDRYSASDAKKDFEYVNLRISANESRISALEKRRVVKVKEETELI